VERFGKKLLIDIALPVSTDTDISRQCRVAGVVSL